MNDKYSTTEGKTSEKLSDEAMLSAQWKNIDWHKAEREVNRLQIRIVKATQQKDYNAVKRLQYLLTHSFYAKALAVKRVVTNDGRRTPGVDGVLWNTPAKKMAAALSLTDKRYRARPLRRVYIEKKDKKKKRPLGIPTMYDRAMQDILASNPDIVAVFAENDNMALGAASAIEEAGKKGEILVFGFDGNDSAVEAIKDGTMAGTIAQQPVEIGKLGIDLAIQKINGEELSYDNADTKEIYADVYLIDNTGVRNDDYKAD